MPTTYRERSMDRLADIGSDLARALGERQRKKRREDLEREFLGGDTVETFKLRQLPAQLEMEQQLNRLRVSRERAQIAKALREGHQPRSGYRGRPLVQTPHGLMTAAEWSREQRQWQNPSGTRKDPERKLADSLTGKLNEDLIEAGAITMDDVPRLTNQRLLNADDSPYTDEDAKLGTGSAYFAADLPEPGGKVRAVRMPQAKFEALRNQYDGVTRLRAQAPQQGSSRAASVYAEMTRPQVADSDDPVEVKTPEQRDMLPPGTRYYAPDGSIRVKR